MVDFVYIAQRGLSLRGDEAGAWMANTDTETLSGVELVTNGGMSSTASWVPTNASLSIVSGRLRVTCTSNGGFSVSQVLSPVSGDTVLLSYHIFSINMTGSIFVNVSGMTGQTHFSGFNQLNSVTFTSDGPGNIVFTGSSASVSGDYFELDNVSLRFAEKDLSINNNGLGVYGSINKSSVSTGATLTGYSNFGAANYLERHHGGDFNFGSGDFTVQAWLKQTGTISSTQNPVQLGQSSVCSINILRETASGAKRIGFLVRGDTTFVTAFSSVTMVTGEWVNMVLMRRSGVVILYINGIQEVALSLNVGNLVPTITDTLKIGYGSLSVSSSEIDISMVRVIGSALSNGQVKSAYDEEKRLFEIHSTYTQSGEEYTLSIPLSTANESLKTVKTDSFTLSGKAQSIIQREDDEWSLSTDLLHLTDSENFVLVSAVKEFFYSTRGSEVFSMDLHEFGAENFIRIGSGVNFSREGDGHWFRASFTVRAVNS